MLQSGICWRQRPMRTKCLPHALSCRTLAWPSLRFGAQSVFKARGLGPAPSAGGDRPKAKLHLWINGQIFPCPRTKRGQCGTLSASACGRPWFAVSAVPCHAQQKAWLSALQLVFASSDGQKGADLAWSCTLGSGKRNPSSKTPAPGPAGDTAHPNR